jgi:hypothetical protein
MSNMCATKTIKNRYIGYAGTAFFPLERSTYPFITEELCEIWLS